MRFLCKLALYLVLTTVVAFGPVARPAASLVKAMRHQPPCQARPKAVQGQRLANGDAGRSQDGAGEPFMKRRPKVWLFRFHSGGHLRGLLSAAMKAADLSFPRRQRGFHLFCHTDGTWMTLRRFGYLRTHENQPLERPAICCNHSEVSAESRRADLFPVQKVGA
jgi:hypothetical protein